eukprot:PhM_4_TR15123/c0_g3_i1/m.22510
MLGTQIVALIRKELRISRRNKRSTLGELLVPLVIGSMCAVMIYLQNHMYASDTPTLHSHDMVWGNSWEALVTYHNGTLPAELQRYYDLHHSQPGANFTKMPSFQSGLYDYTLLPQDARHAALLVDEADGHKYTVGVSPLGQDNATAVATPLWYLMSALVPLPWEPTVTMRSASKSNMNFKLLFCMTAATFITVAFMPGTIITAGRMVEEKVGKVKELLKVMGLKDQAYFISHFIAAQIRAFPGIIFLTIAMLIFKGIQPSDAPLFLLANIIFSFSATSFAFLMPVFFSRAVWSNVSCVIFIYMLAELANLVTGAPDGLQKLACLASPIAFFYIMMHLFAGAVFTSAVTLEFALVMVVFDTFIYLLLGLYLIQLFPGEFGVPKHPLFFLGIGKKHTSASKNLESIPACVNDRNETTQCISFENLRKTYPGADVSAVDGLRLGVRQGEIFALLGHNGAGKTTTMNMLTGLIPPTTYDTAEVNGLDIVDSIDQIRSSLGVCPQFDVLFGDLTAREHLELFSEMRGLHNAEGQSARIEGLLCSLELPDESTAENKTAGKYSGGMKRRLSVGISLVGNNALIILDEPSSGLDPLSRRKLWQVIKSEKLAGRTVLLSTHFMEEADYLGDRIGIMSKGKMYCTGTSSDLKHKFGCGFYLRLVRDDKAEADACDITKIEALVTSHIPTATVSGKTSGDITMLLPPNATAQFEPLLRHLDQEKHTLGIHSYGLSMNSLEDVFVSISSNEEQVAAAASHDARGSLLDRQELEESTAHINSMDTRCVAAQEVTAFARWKCQVDTLLRRRLYMFSRNTTLKVFFLAMPAFFIIVALLSLPKNVDRHADGPRGPPQLNDFSQESTDLQNLDFVFLDTVNNADSNSIADAIETTYARYYGPGGAIRLRRLHDIRDFAFGYFVESGNVAFNAISKPGISGFYLTEANIVKKSVNVTVMVNPSTTGTNTMALTSLLRGAMDTVLNVHNPTPLTLNVTEMSHISRNANYTAPDATAHYQTTVLQMYAVIAIVLVVSYSVVSVAEEMKHRIYHNMRLNDLSPLAYWCSNLFHDLLWCSIPLLIIILGIYLKPIEQLQGAPMLFLVISYIMFALQASLQCFCLAVWKDSMRPVMYVVAMELISMGSVGVPALTILLLRSVTSSALWVDQAEPYILALFPASCFFQVFDSLGLYTDANTPASNIFSDNHSLIGIVILLAPLHFIVPVLILRRFSKGEQRGHQAYTKPKNYGIEDEDVLRESQRVLDGQAYLDMVTAHNVVKVYGSGSHAKVAVNGVSFGIKRGECFGLLGPNGAGKTTLIKSLMGEAIPTEGHIRFAACGEETSKELMYRTARLGVCQQHDALWEFLTPVEHMEIYLKLRLTTQYDPVSDGAWIQRALDRVQLDDAKTKISRGFSGGMKRKLGVALAMFTGAETIFLDEPSTGMDPFARRALWSVIHEAIGHSHAVILTTHSMEEADAVCGRISIVTEGALRCIGNSQHLKNRFGAGYVLTVVVDDQYNGKFEDIDRMVCGAFPGSELGEGLEHQRKYALGEVPCLADAFSVLEKNKTEWCLYSYGVAQTSSLEQIFLRFVGTPNA